MPTHKQPNPLPPASELAQWRVERMILVKRPRAIFRRAGITLVIVQTEDGWWHVEKLKGGRTLASKVTHKLSNGHLKLVTGKAS